MSNQLYRKEKTPTGGYTYIPIDTTEIDKDNIKTFLLGQYSSLEDMYASRDEFERLFLEDNNIPVSDVIDLIYNYSYLINNKIDESELPNEPSIEKLFYCADWDRCGSICEKQCTACKKAENMKEIIPDKPEPSIQDDDSELFLKFCNRSKSEFTDYINSLPWDRRLRTKVESFLICFDQLLERYKTKYKQQLNK